MKSKKMFSFKEMSYLGKIGIVSSIILLTGIILYGFFSSIIFLVFKDDSDSPLHCYILIKGPIIWWMHFIIYGTKQSIAISIFVLVQLYAISTLVITMLFAKGKFNSKKLTSILNLLPLIFPGILILLDEGRIEKRSNSVITTNIKNKIIFKEINYFGKTVIVCSIILYSIIAILIIAGLFIIGFSEKLSYFVSNANYYSYGKVSKQGEINLYGKIFIISILILFEIHAIFTLGTTAFFLKGKIKCMKLIAILNLIPFILPGLLILLLDNENEMKSEKNLINNNISNST